MELNNVVIEVLDKEHGKKVIDFFKSKGIDTRFFNGNETKKDNSDSRYYGLINNIFYCYTIQEAENNNAKIVTLEELMKSTNTYPKVMWVSEFPKFETKSKRIVFMEKCGRYLAWSNVETLQEAEKVYSVTDWKYAKDIEPEVSPIKEITMQEIADKFGVSVENLRIKKQ